MDSAATFRGHHFPTSNTQGTPDLIMWQIDQVTLRLFIAVCEEGTSARAAEREFFAGPCAQRYSHRIVMLAIGTLGPKTRDVALEDVSRECFADG
jgi:hypothetical protein